MKESNLSREMVKSIGNLLKNMDDSEINEVVQLCEHEKKRRNLPAFNYKLKQLLEEAEAEGITFIFHDPKAEDDMWCIPVTTENCEAAC